MRPRGRRLHAQDLGHLAVLTPFDRAQHDRRAQALRQSPECVGDLAHDLATSQRIRGRGSGRGVSSGRITTVVSPGLGRIHVPRGPSDLLEANDARALVATTIVVLREVPRDPEDPRGEGRFLPVVGEGTPGADEALLSQVLGVLVVLDHAVKEGVHVGEVAADQRVEGVAIPAPRAADQGLLGRSLAHLVQGSRHRSDCGPGVGTGTDVPEARLSTAFRDPRGRDLPRAEAADSQGFG